MTATLRSPSSFDGDNDTLYLKGLERLLVVVQELSLVRSLDALMAVVRSAARELTGADGATFVLREDDFCHYAEESAIAPLWKGKRFPLGQCVSGWAMTHRQPVVIEDIYDDPRVPTEAYRPTFVKSLVMVPIRTIAPVGAIGNYWAKRHRASDAEVKLLAALADSTSIAMENVQLYTSLEARVAERTAALHAKQAELAAKNEALVRLQAQKEELASLLVHDLKSPAGGILMTSRSRLRSAQLADGERRHWKNVEASAEAIQRLALNILDVTRSEDGAFAAKTAPLALAPLLHDVVELMTPLADGRDQKIELEDRTGAVLLDADGELLRRALQNLLDNAIRHSPASSTVRLLASRADGGVELCVADEGSGIPESLRAEIFEKYRRGDESCDTGHAVGRGLGLAFCRLAARAHGGEVRVSENTPRGAVFTLQLPESAVVDPATRAMPA